MLSLVSIAVCLLPRLFNSIATLLVRVLGQQLFHPGDIVACSAKRQTWSADSPVSQRPFYSPKSWKERELKNKYGCQTWQQREAQYQSNLHSRQHGESHETCTPAILTLPRKKAKHHRQQCVRRVRQRVQAVSRLSLRLAALP